MVVSSIPGSRTIGRLEWEWVTVWVCNQPPRPTQPYTLCGTENEYQAKCSGALQLKVLVKQDGSFHSKLNVWVADKTVCCLVLNVFSFGIGRHNEQTD